MVHKLDGNVNINFSPIPNP